MKYLPLLVLISACTKQTVKERSVSPFYRLSIVNQDKDTVTSNISRITDTEVISAIQTDNFCLTHPDHFKCTCLPITLDYFNAARSEDYLVAEWKTSLEERVEEFIIERSDDGSSFVPMARIKPVGPSYYRTRIRL